MFTLLLFQSIISFSIPSSTFKPFRGNAHIHSYENMDLWIQILQIPSVWGLTKLWLWAAVPGFFQLPQIFLCFKCTAFCSFFFYVCSLCVHLIAMSVDLIFLYLMINSRTQFTLNSLVKDPQWFCSVNLSIHVLIFMNIKCINIHFSCLITLVVFHNHQFHRYM